MNFHKAKILLEKINRLHASMNDDQDNISSIEKDLMLNYVREYYEVFYWDKEQAAPKKESKPVKKTPAPKPAPVVTAPPPPKPKPVVETPAPPKPKPVVAAPPKPEPVMEEVKEVIDVVASPPKETPKPKAPEPKKEPAKFVFTPPKPKVEKKSDIDPESEELFETKKATDISEKLGLSPIMDLNKAFGLNDRMLYTNELFNGDNNVYKETMGILNSFNSLEQAKVYLIENVAGKYNWTSKAKKKQAKEFIRTISRKYNS